MADDIFELELTTMAHGGRAMGRHQGRVVFVPYAIPGERIEARLTGRSGRVAFAEGLRLLEASADRVWPQCPHFGPGRCGQCQWQHIDYAAQLLLKQDVLADQLARIGGLDDVEVLPTIPAPATQGYRWGLTLRVDRAGQPGLPSDRAGQVVWPEECHVAHPDLLDFLPRLELDIEGLRELQLLRGSDGALMLLLTMRNDRAPELLSDLPASVNMLLKGGEPVNLIGASHLLREIAGRRFRVTAGSSFRAHDALLPQLATLVREWLAPSRGEHVLDLYAGVGFFSAFLAEEAGLVTLVERFPPAVTDAGSNLEAFDNIDLIEGRVEEVLPELETPVDAALLDPPREGLSAEAVDALAECGAARLVYVSGDAATLARDARRLRARGWRLRQAQPVDLEPLTWRIHTVALLERRA
ncbi:MAG: hypothetical protein OXF32_01300 [Anaerolineaceae bacterium]|nr:hypothetical protein [Anaerolineaceae bacterium]